MFSILHERPIGAQELFKVASIQYLPPTLENEGVAGVHLLASPDEAGPGIRVGTLRDGRVFVMNDHGATVGRFYLDVPPAPPNGMGSI